MDTEQSGRWRPWAWMFALLFCVGSVGCRDWIAVTLPLALQVGTKSPAEKPGTKPANKATAQPLAKPAVKAPPATEGIRLPVFEGWSTPQVAILVSGRQNGYIEPCGCAGLANQKGGLSRRHSLIRQLSERGWPVVAMDVGNQVKRYGRQSEIKFQVSFDGLKRMGYQAIGLGPDDLRLSSGELLSSISDEPGRFVGANVAVLDRDLMPRYRVIEAGGLKIGVTSVLGDEYRRNLQGDEVTHEAAAAGLEKAAKLLAAQKCDYQVLLAYASLGESRALGRRFPQFRLVVTAGGGEEPEFEPEKIEGTPNWLIQVGTKGMYVGVVGIFADKQRPLRYQRVPLDGRYPDSPEMLRLLAAYQDQLQAAGLDGLGPKPVAHPSGRSFVGSQACADCHAKADEVWRETSHAHALDTLVRPKERSEVARHFDPECLSCHVVGWEHQKFFPYKSGYLSLEATPELKHVGCENCHGPGAAHVAAEEGELKATDAMIARLRAEMRLPLAKAREKCLECHDMDNSPNFHKEGAFDEYWKKVAHKGKD